MIEWHHWDQWHRACALAKCDEATKSALRGFAWARWRVYAAGCLGGPDAEIPAGAIPSAVDAWHDFESSMRLRNTKQGKAYKQWLFARVPSGASAEQALDAVQSGASVILRDVVRERFRREMPRRGEFSLDAPVSGSSPTMPSVMELLPSPADPICAVEAHDLEELGRSMAVFLARHILSPREKTVLLAREKGLPLSDPSMLAAAGCKKSVLCTAYHSALRKTADVVTDRYPDEDRSTRALLAVAAFQALAPAILSSPESEMGGAGFFRIEKGVPVGKGPAGKRGSRP